MPCDSGFGHPEAEILLNLSFLWAVCVGFSRKERTKACGMIPVGTNFFIGYSGYALRAPTARRLESSTVAHQRAL